MNYFFKISKYLNVFDNGNSKTRLLKKQFKAVYVFKQLIASIGFQTILTFIGYSADVYQTETHTPCFQINFFQSLLKLCLQHLAVNVDQEYLQVPVFFCFGGLTTSMYFFAFFKFEPSTIH